MGILNSVELQSSAWKKIEQHINERIAALRLKNDGDLEPVETARLRGQIAALKGLLARVESVPVQEADGPI